MLQRFCVLRTLLQGAVGSLKGRGSWSLWSAGLLCVFALSTLPLTAQPLGFTSSAPPTIRIADTDITACGGTLEAPVFFRFSR